MKYQAPANSFIQSSVKFLKSITSGLIDYKTNSEITREIRRKDSGSSKPGFAKQITTIELTEMPKIVLECSTPKPVTIDSNMKSALVSPKKTTFSFVPTSSSDSKEGSTPLETLHDAAESEENENKDEEKDEKAKAIYEDDEEEGAKETDAPSVSFFSRLCSWISCFRSSANDDYNSHEDERNDFIDDIDETDDTVRTILAKRKVKARRGLIDYNKFVLKHVQETDATTVFGRIWLFALLQVHVRMRKWATHENYTIFSNCVAIVNMILLGMSTYGMTYEHGLYVAGRVCEWLFILDSCFLIVALGPKFFFANNTHVINFVVSIIIIIDFADVVPRIGLVYAKNSPLRVFTILRLLSSIEKWRALFRLLLAVNNSIVDIGNISFGLVLYLSMYAILGMQLFKGKMSWSGYTARANFDNFGWSFITVFQIITPENWNTVVMDTVHARGWMAVLYTVPLCLIGHYVVELIFLVILLSNIPDDSSIDNESDTNTFSLKKQAKIFVELAHEKIKHLSDLSSKLHLPDLPDALPPTNLSLNRYSLSRRSTKRRMTHQIWASQEESALLLIQPLPQALPHRKKQEKILTQILNEISRSAAEETSQKESKEETVGECCLPQSIIHFCEGVVTNRYFAALMMCVVLFSCFVMVVAAGVPLKRASKLSYDFQWYSSWTVLVMFFVEFLLKILARGRKYFSSVWDVLDFFLLIVCVLDVAEFFTNVASVKFLRGLRSSRVLRLISDIPSIKIILTALYHAFVSCWNLVLFMLFVLYTYSIIGMQLFQVTLH
jgi:hypothetical protein